VYQVGTNKGIVCLCSFVPCRFYIGIVSTPISYTWCCWFDSWHGSQLYWQLFL